MYYSGKQKQLHSERIRLLSRQGNIPTDPTGLNRQNQQTNHHLH